MAAKMTETTKIAAGTTIYVQRKEIRLVELVDSAGAGVVMGGLLAQSNYE